jgi:transcriptional regulator with XRE-family HTH domain
MNQREVSSLLQTSDANISRWVNGERQIKPRVARQIAKVLGATLAVPQGAATDIYHFLPIVTPSPVTDRAAVAQAATLPNGGGAGAPDNGLKSKVQSQDDEQLIGKAQRVTRKMLAEDRRRARRGGAA